MVKWAPQVLFIFISVILVSFLSTCSAEEDKALHRNTRSVIDVSSNSEMARMLLLLKDEARQTFFSDCIKHFCEDHELKKHNSDMWISKEVKDANNDRFWATYRCTVKKQPSACPVDGGWTQWSEWDYCSLTCGHGLQHRRRTCSNPLPHNGGYACDGLAIDTLRCQERPCPEKGHAHHQVSSVQAAKDRLNEVHAVHPQLEQLCVFAKCSYDQVTHLLPNKHEVNSYWSDLSCYKYSRSCRVDGQWSEWGPWSDCSINCGQGSTVRQRNCTDPAPQNGGWRCLGKSIEIKPCTRNEKCSSGNCAAVLLEGTPLNEVHLHTMTVYSVIDGAANGLPVFASKPGNVACKGRCYLYSTKHGEEDKGLWCFGASLGDNKCYFVGQGPIGQHPAKIKQINEYVDGEFHANPDVHVICNEDAKEWMYTWSPWGQCQGEPYCSIGTRHRQMTCPKAIEGCPQHNQARSDVVATAEELCTLPPCQVDGGWSGWSEWSVSTSDCGEGKQGRFRTCNQPAPKAHGKDCPGPRLLVVAVDVPCEEEGVHRRHKRADEVQDVIDEEHSIDYNLVDGQHSMDETVAGGQHSMDENVVNGQHSMDENVVEQHSMDENYVNGQHSMDDNYGQGQHSMDENVVDGQHSMDENYVNGQHSMDDNFVQGQHSMDENFVQGQHSMDDNFVQGPRSIPMDENYMHDEHSVNEANRDYEYEDISHGDTGASEEEEEDVIAELTDEESKTTSEGMVVFPSFLQIAGEHSPDLAYLSDWGQWTACTRSCGEGIRRRQRNCLWKERKCRGDIRDIQLCNIQPCPVHGGFSDWSQWSPCSLTCGEGTMSRNRVCTNPAPSHGGQVCEGPDREEKACQKSKCPNSAVDQTWQWQSWESWQPCDRTCDMGYRQRRRGCMVKPGATQSDAKLNCIGRRVEVMECQVAECAENGNWAAWTSWSSCTATCGEGVRTRDRTCTDPAPSGDGEECEGQGTEVEHCSIPPCIETDGTTRIFSKDSYLMYPAPTHPAHVWRAFIRFFPYTGDGLLLWTSQENNDEDDNVNIELGLKEGLIVFKAVLGKEEVDVLGDEPKIDAWNDVVATIAGERASLRVNDGDIREKSFSVGPPRVSFGGQLFLGGSFAYTKDSFFKTGFQGKVCDLWLNYQQYSLKEYAWKGDRIPVEGHKSADEKTDLVAASLLFSGQEYAEILITPPKNVQGSFTISMVLMPSEGEGFLFFNKGTEVGTYIIVLLTDNRIVLKLGLGWADVQTTSEELKLKRWMHLQLTITKRGDAEMRINSGPATQLSCEGMQYQPDPSLMIGGVTEALWKDLVEYQHVPEKRGFTGAIYSVKVYGQEFKMADVALQKRGQMLNSATTAKAAHYKEIVATEGSSLKLRCDYSFIVGENPSKAHVIWMKEDRRQHEGKFVSITQGEPENKYVSTLHLRDLHSSMTGSYSCLVEYGGRAVVTNAYGILVQPPLSISGKTRMTPTEADNLVLEIILLVLLVPFLVVIGVCCAARIRCCQERFPFLGILYNQMVEKAGKSRIVRRAGEAVQRAGQSTVVRRAGEAVQRAGQSKVVRTAGEAMQSIKTGVVDKAGEAIKSIKTKAATTLQGDSGFAQLHHKIGAKILPKLYQKEPGSRTDDEERVKESPDHETVVSLSPVAPASKTSLPMAENVSPAVSLYSNMSLVDKRRSLTKIASKDADACECSPTSKSVLPEHVSCTMTSTLSPSPSGAKRRLSMGEVPSTPPSSDFLISSPSTTPLQSKVSASVPASPERFSISTPESSPLPSPEKQKPPGPPPVAGPPSAAGSPGPPPAAGPPGPPPAAGPPGPPPAAGPLGPPAAAGPPPAAGPPGPPPAAGPPGPPPAAGPSGPPPAAGPPGSPPAAGPSGPPPAAGPPGPPPAAGPPGPPPAAGPPGPPPAAGPPGPPPASGPPGPPPAAGPPGPPPAAGPPGPPPAAGPPPPPPPPPWSGRRLSRSDYG